MKRTISLFALFLLSILQVKSQICQDIDQYGQCSINSACGCFHMIDADNSGVCGFLWPTCSQLQPCNSTNNACQQPDTICVHHPRCQSFPICYPTSMIDQRVCPSPSPPPSMTTTTTTTTTAAATITTEQIVNVSTTSIQWTSTSTTTAPPKCPKLITFDNIQNAVRTPQPMPLGFSGFQWVNANYMNVTYHEQINGLSGYSAALSSGHFIAVNKDGQNLNVIINAAESFSLKSMVVASAWNDNLILEITGKRGGAVLNSKKLTLDMKPQQIDLNWSHLEVVTFSAYNGASNSTEKGKETSFGFDNLCIEFTK